ncbi:FliH/SctL family protein [Sandarakinorhabdus sp.]|uniref:FliH/SctL family protein n=1 Tax=Sandarakinorhabdus sp. TaxID=1916663 RepID=UPI003F6F0098
MSALLGAPAPAAGLARLLASLNPPPEPEPAPEPAIDLAALLTEARAEGEAAGRTAGEAQGRAAAEAALAPLKSALTVAADAARAACAIDEEALRPLLIGLVQAVAQTVLMAELTAGRRALAPLVAAALAEVAESALPTLTAHPDTLALINADLPPGLITRPDPALPPGHVAVAGPDYRIEAGLAERLARIIAVLP